MHGPVKEWKAPESVLEMAKHLTVGRDVQDRLLHDPPMRSLWVSLGRANPKITRESLDALRPYMRLSSYGVQMVELRLGVPHLRFTLADEACAAFFALCAVELNPKMKRPVVTQAALDKLAAEYRIAERCCIAMLDDPAIHHNPERKKAYEIVKADMAKEAQEIEVRKGPLIIENNTEDDELRVRVRNFAVEARKIFGGDFRIETLATAVNVVMNKAVNRSRLRNRLRDI